MKRMPKYIVIPALLLIYFVAVAAWSIWKRGGVLPENFVVTVAVELAIVVAVFFLLRRFRR